MLGKSVLLAAVLLAVFASSSSGFTCTGASCVPTWTYIEPSTYVSGAPLTNLQDGLVTYQVNGGANQTFTIPASRPQGGGTVTITTVTIPVAVCTISTITSSVVARTTAGGVSAPLAGTPLVMDRTKLATGLPDPQCTTPSSGSITVQ